MTTTTTCDRLTNVLAGPSLTVPLPRFEFHPRRTESFRPAASSLIDASREVHLPSLRKVFSATLDLLLAVAGGTAVGYAFYTILSFASTF